MDFFKKLKETSILDDTFIIVVGDHGFRIGEYFSTTAGEYEARYGRILSTSFYGNLSYRPQRSCFKVMFLHVSVILFTGGGSGRQTHSPGRQTPPRDSHCNGRYASYWITFLLMEYF